MRLSLRLLSFFLVLLPAAAHAQQAPGTRLLVVLPFENVSNVPGIEWIGEAFSEVLGERIASAAPIYVVGRAERLHALDRLGIPAHSRPSRATLIRIAEAMDVGYVVVGSYDFDGNTFTARAQLLDMRRLSLSPEIREAGPLVGLLDIQTQLAWELLRLLDPQLAVARNQFVAAAAPVRLDALENYIRGVIAGSRQEKLRYLRNAVRIHPDYTQAKLQLGKSFLEGQEYEQAATWLNRVPTGTPQAAEAYFYRGLADFYRGDYAGAESAFVFVASRAPLGEVHNNLGVVASRRGKPEAAEHFRRAVQLDPREPDFRFNLAVSLYRHGDATAAARELREALALGPADAEARAFLATITGTAPAGAARSTVTPARTLPLERIKRGYDERAFRRLLRDSRDKAPPAGSRPGGEAAFHVERGSELLRQGLAQEAERVFREAILLDPTDAGGHAGLAAVLEQRGDISGARAEAGAALRLRPLARAFVVLARLDMRENKIESAQENIRRALALEPEHPEARALQQELGRSR